MPLLLRVHGGLMVLAFAIMFTGFIVARYMKPKRWWLKLHKTAEITGACVICAALIAIILQITLAGRSHFEVPHAYVGAVIALLSLITLTLGFMQFKIRGAAEKLRNFHRWSGRITLLLIFINILVGLDLIGVI